MAGQVDVVDAVDLVDQRGNTLLRLQSTTSTLSIVSTTPARAPSRRRLLLGPRF